MIHLAQVPSADPRGEAGTPLMSKFFHFHAVFGKKCKIVDFEELSPLRQENPGSATGYIGNFQVPSE